MIEMRIGSNSIKKNRRPPCCTSLNRRKINNGLDGRSKIGKYSNNTIWFISTNMKPYR